MELGYMKHDINTMNDIKIRRLVQAEGAQGYALFWHLVECIYQNDGSFARNDVDLVGRDLGVSQEDSQRIIGRMLKLGLLYEQEGGVLRSKRVDKDMREISEKCENYRNMASKRWKKPAENPSENTPDEKPRQCAGNAQAMPQQCHSNAKAMQGSVLGSGSEKESSLRDSQKKDDHETDDLSQTKTQGEGPDQSQGTQPWHAALTDGQRASLTNTYWPQAVEWGTGQLEQAVNRRDGKFTAPSNTPAAIDGIIRKAIVSGELRKPSSPTTDLYGTVYNGGYCPHCGGQLEAGHVCRTCGKNWIHMPQDDSWQETDLYDPSKDPRYEGKSLDEIAAMFSGEKGTPISGITALR